jgi:hypothetical protein
MKLRDLLGGKAARANGSELPDAADGLESAHSANRTGSEA